MIQRTLPAGGGGTNGSVLIETAARPYFSPVPHRAVFEAVHRQVRALVRVLRGELFVDVDAEPGALAGVQIALRERVAVREYGVGLGGVGHVLLDAEVRHREIEVQRGG